MHIILPGEIISFELHDFYHIEEWTVDGHKAAHQADLEWLNDQVAEIATFEPY